MHWFYKNESIGDRFIADQDESKHISKVLRLEVGDKVVFTDGKGGQFICVLRDANPKRCLFETIEKKTFPKPRRFRIHVAVAPTKNISRLEWFIEKATEIGIDEITPLQSEHSERIRIKNERLEKITISALKQSQQVWLPKMNELTKFESLIAEHRIKNQQKFIAYVSEAHDSLLKEKYIPGKDALILIGPEGDFSTDEINKALEMGFEPISLGDNRLRTETAALVSCHTIVLMNQ